MFGSHRWFAGGGSPSLVAITTIEQWDDEIARGRPGDNIILLSLRKVAQMALVHAWDASTPRPEALRPEDAAVIEAYDRTAKLGELLCVRQFTPTSGQVEAALDRIDLRDLSVTWQEQLARLLPGEARSGCSMANSTGGTTSIASEGRTARVMDSPREHPLDRHERGEGRARRRRGDRRRRHPVQPAAHGVAGRRRIGNPEQRQHPEHPRQGRLGQVDGRGRRGRRRRDAGPGRRTRSS